MQGDELRAIRKHMGWTLETMGRALGMSITFISQMERDQRPIERRTALAARFLASTGGNVPDGD